MTTKEMMEVIQAYEDGKTIEVRLKVKNNDGTWAETHLPIFDFNSYEYRIKPEAKKIPLGPDDMTPTTWIRSNNNTSNDHLCHLLYWKKDKVYYYEQDSVVSSTYEYLMENCQISTTPDKFNWRPAYKLSDKHTKEDKVYHGGCVGCTSQTIFGVDRCNGCQFKEADWSKPNLFLL